MAVFRIINNTASLLPLSTSASVPPGGTRDVSQLTIELKRLEAKNLITIVKLDNQELSLDEVLSAGLMPDACASDGDCEAHWTRVSW